jgi:hypothetical protein
MFAYEDENAEIEELLYHYICFLPDFTVVNGFKESPVEIETSEEFPLCVFKYIKERVEEGSLGEDLSLMALIVD